MDLVAPRKQARSVPPDFLAVLPYVAIAYAIDTEPAACCCRLTWDGDRLWNPQLINRVHGQSKTTRLHAAARAGWLSRVQILCDHGANADAKDSANRTPVLEAMAGCHSFVIKELLTRGAQPFRPLAGILEFKLERLIDDEDMADDELDFLGMWALAVLPAGKVVLAGLNIHPHLQSVSHSLCW